MPELLKILFTQPKQRRAIDFRVAADEITEARPDLAAFLVEHHLGRIILERAVVIPIILLARQERPPFQNQDILSARRQAIQQRSTAGPGSNNDYVVVFGHTAFGRKKALILTN